MLTVQGNSKAHTFIFSISFFDFLNLSFYLFFSQIFVILQMQNDITLNFEMA